ncbi:hypothetical protein GpartN1_g5398.t1 [Galdieria partita]|uniref:C2 NT-type domain-containing protein n=1 Tax=Galdieria partita TaxID=83374 RepID=A0A9C7Q154_9RHOD|nr:hypothetical protein GpartN1_g5398.t1 [Galdieria partita]
MNVFGKASKSLQRIGSTPRKYLVEFELKRLQGLMEYLAIKRESAPVCVTVSKGGKSVASRPSNNGVWNEKLSMQITLFEKTTGNEPYLEPKKLTFEVHLVKGGTKLLIGSAEIDVASVAAINGESYSRELELLLKGASSNSLRGTELKLSVRMSTSGLHADTESTSSPRSLGRSSTQSYSTVASEASSPLSSGTPLESPSSNSHMESSLPVLPRIPTSDERRFSLFSKIANSRISPTEPLKYPSSSSSRQSENEENMPATQDKVMTERETKSPQSRGSSRASSLFGSLRSKVDAEAKEQRRTPQGRADNTNTNMSPKSPEMSDSPILQRSFSQLSYSGESKMNDVDILREQLRKERDRSKAMEEELKHKDEQIRLNKASYQEELHQLTSMLFQERNKLSVVEEQRRKLQQELNALREKNVSPDAIKKESSLYEENNRLKEENRELKEKLDSLDKYSWSNTNGSPLNVNVTPLLENNAKSGKYDGPFTVGQLVQELVSMKVKYAESQSELEKERQRMRNLSQMLETSKRQNNTVALEMSQLQKEISALRREKGKKMEQNNLNSPSSKRIAADRSLDMENQVQNDDVSLRRSLKKKAKGWKKVFH